jgi:hypothetical protein
MTIDWSDPEQRAAYARERYHNRVKLEKEWKKQEEEKRKHELE